MIKGIEIDADYLIFECAETRDKKALISQLKMGYEDKGYKKQTGLF